MQGQLLCSTADGAAPGGRLLDRVGVVIPTYKAELHWALLQPSLAMQGISPDRILVVDSDTGDSTQRLARESGYHVVSIPQSEFNHGGTRQFALQYLPGAEFIVYLTQDVVFASPDSLLSLCRTMEDPQVGAAYGRQLPREAAGPIERHARLFNYPAEAHVRSFEDRHAMGIRAAFFSNSFSVYRRTALESVGGFPAKVITAEDSFVVTRLLQAGWKIAYAADAAVIHSHPFSIEQEFKRYFDTGAQHAREPWILETCGRAGGEGLKFVRSELKYLAANAKRDIPLALLRTGSKLLGYRLGLLSTKFPSAWSRRLSSQPHLWK